jgi:predicted metal-dependent hydrolase
MYNTKQYDLEIIVNPRLKHSYLSIPHGGKVVVKTPYKSQKFINSLLESKKEWIEEKLIQIRNKQVLPSQPLHTLEYLQNKVVFYSMLMQLQYTQLKFRKMRRRWGSCSSQGVITLNKELLKVDPRLVDYVVVHELAHLKHMNHSKQFHALVENYLPNAPQLRKELKNIQIVLA